MIYWIFTPRIHVPQLSLFFDSTRSIRMSNPRDSILQASQSTPASLGSAPTTSNTTESISDTPEPSSPSGSAPSTSPGSSSAVLVPRPSLPTSSEVSSGARAAGLRRAMPVRTSQHAPALKRPRRARPNSGPPNLSQETRSATETVQISDEDEGSGSEPFVAAQAEVGSESALVHVESWVGPMEPTHAFHGGTSTSSQGQEDVMDFYATPAPTSPPSPMRPTTVMRDSGGKYLD